MKTELTLFGCCNNCRWIRDIRGTLNYTCPKHKRMLLSNTFPCNLYDVAKEVMRSIGNHKNIKHSTITQIKNILKAECILDEQYNEELTKLQKRREEKKLQIMEDVLNK